jgi:hypothetical protein
MSLAELVILSVKVEGRSKSEVAGDYKISRYWVQQRACQKVCVRA